MHGLLGPGLGSYGMGLRRCGRRLGVLCLACNDCKSAPRGIFDAKCTAIDDSMDIPGVRAKLIGLGQCEVAVNQCLFGVVDSIGVVASAVMRLESCA